MDECKPPAASVFSSATFSAFSFSDASSFPTSPLFLVPAASSSFLTRSRASRVLDSAYCSRPSSQGLILVLWLFAHSVPLYPYTLAASSSLACPLLPGGMSTPVTWKYRAGKGELSGLAGFT